jgi:hypothetical protein
MSYNNRNLMIVDTPGLNDSRGDDLTNMAMVVKAMRGFSVLGLIICIRVDGKMDIQFRQTISYYCELFRSCLERNLIIVLTNVKMDVKSQRQRTRDKFDLSVVTNQVREAVSEVAGLKLHCPVWLIDSCTEPEDVEEYNTALDSRATILHDCISRIATPLAAMELVKTPELRQQDDEKLAFIQGELDGYKRGLVDVKAMEASTSQKFGASTRELSQLRIALSEAQATLEQFDNDSLVPVKSETYQSGWTWSWNEHAVSLHADSLISSYKLTTISGAELTNVNLSENDLTGSLVGSFFRPIQATVTLFSTSRAAHAKVIAAAQKSVAALGASIRSTEESLGQLTSTIKNHQDAIEKLEKFVRDLSELAQIIGRRTIAVEEFFNDDPIFSDDDAALSRSTPSAPACDEPSHPIRSLASTPPTKQPFSLNLSDPFVRNTTPLSSPLHSNSSYANLSHSLPQSLPHSSSSLPSSPSSPSSSSSLNFVHSRNLSQTSPLRPRPQEYGTPPQSHPSPSLTRFPQDKQQKQQQRRK